MVLGCLFTMLGAKPTARSPAGGGSPPPGSPPPGSPPTGSHAAPQPSPSALYPRSAGIPSGLPSPGPGNQGPSSASPAPPGAGAARLGDDGGGLATCAGGGGDGRGWSGGWSGGGRSGWFGGSFGADGASDGDGVMPLNGRRVAAAVLVVAALWAVWKLWRRFAPALLRARDPEPWAVAKAISQWQSGSDTPTQGEIGSNAQQQRLSGMVAGSAAAAGGLARSSFVGVSSLGTRLWGWSRRLPHSAAQVLQRPLAGLALPDALTAPLHWRRTSLSRCDRDGVWPGVDRWAWWGHWPSPAPATPAAAPQAASCWSQSFPVPLTWQLEREGFAHFNRHGLCADRWPPSNPYGLWHGVDHCSWQGQSPSPVPAPPVAAPPQAASALPHSPPVKQPAPASMPRLPPRKVAVERLSVVVPRAQTASGAVGPSGGAAPTSSTSKAVRSSKLALPCVSLRDEIAALTAERDRLQATQRRAEQWLACRGCFGGLLGKCGGEPASVVQ